MKSQDETISEIHLADSIFSLMPSNSPNIKCFLGNEAFQYCFNPNCLHEIAFLCGTRKCKCREQHKLCPKADLDFTIQHLNDKIVDTSHIKESVECEFQKIIDHLSNLRDTLITLIQDQVKYSMLHEPQKAFLLCINKNELSKFNSKQSSRLWNIINKKYQPKNDIFTEINQGIKEFHQEVEDLSTSLEQQIQNVIKKQQLQEVKQQIIQKQPIFDIFKAKSSVITEDAHIQYLQKMFDNKISSVELIFKASDHKFDLKQYYEICGNTTETMIICKTNKDKIIGGYTPVSFNPLSNKMDYVSDESGQSMIFSVSQNDKFELKQKTKAIRHMPDKSHLRIGNAEFDICDKADSVMDCYTYLMNQFYSNPKYKNDKESYLKLNGNQSFKFSTKEWEVWKIQLHPQED